MPNNNLGDPQGKPNRPKKNKGAGFDDSGSPQGPPGGGGGGNGGNGGGGGGGGGGTTYTVQAGDSPARIAQKMYGDQRYFNVIQGLLKGQMPTAGMKLKLPNLDKYMKNLQASGQQHLVTNAEAEAAGMTYRTPRYANQPGTGNPQVTPNLTNPSSSQVVSPSTSPAQYAPPTGAPPVGYGYRPPTASAPASSAAPNYSALAAQTPWKRPTTGGSLSPDKQGYTPSLYPGPGEFTRSRIPKPPLEFDPWTGSIFGVPLDPYNNANPYSPSTLSPDSGFNQPTPIGNAPLGPDSPYYQPPIPTTKIGEPRPRGPLGVPPGYRYPGVAPMPEAPYSPPGGGPPGGGGVYYPPGWGGGGGGGGGGGNPRGGVSRGASGRGYQAPVYAQSSNMPGGGRNPGRDQASLSRTGLVMFRV